MVELTTTQSMKDGIHNPGLIQQFYLRDQQNLQLFDNIQVRADNPLWVPESVFQLWD